MKLDYNILWIDNDLQSYIDNGSVESIEEFLHDRGFEATIEKVFDEADLDEFIDKHEYDLIISDYNLENTTGDVIIEQIRDEKDLDTEILFYTAQESYKDKSEVIERLAFKERLTFQIGRDNLLAKIEKVIALTIRRLLEINATRGLLTAATSDLDGDIAEIFEQLIDGSTDSTDQMAISAVLAKDFKEIKKHSLKLCKSKRDCHSSDFKLYFSLSDSFRKYRILKNVLKLKEFESFDLALFGKYDPEVIQIRNKFAHAKVIKNESGQLVLKGRIDSEDFEYNESNCIELRKKIIAHKRNINNLRIAVERLRSGTS